MLRYILLGALLGILWDQASAQTREDIVNNVGGYKVERAPTYIIMTSRKVRPNQVFQVFATILRLEYSEISLRVSIIKDNTEFAEAVMQFDQPGSRIMQMLMPANAQNGNYKVKVEGMLNNGAGGYAFYNETDIAFDAKQASLFIQLSKPIFRQGQSVHFRVIPILPDMTPMYGSLTIYVYDPTGFPVRRWLGLQTNAGGFVSQNFTLSDQPNYGNWSIRVDAYGFQYVKYFQVEEYWNPRFDLNVTTAPYVMDNVQHIRGVVMANITTGKSVLGSADVVVTLKPPNIYPYDNYMQQFGQFRDPWDYSIYPQIYKHYDYFNGRINFEFSREELINAARTKWPNVQNLIDFECIFNVSAKDWFFNMTQTGYASTVVFNPDVKLMYIGDKVRTFKPNSIMTVYVAVMYYDGTPVYDPVRKVQINKRYTGGTGSGLNTQPEEKVPINGVATFDIRIPEELSSIEISATYDFNIRNTIVLKATRYYSPSNSYISVRTSTQHPQVNEFMIFHVKTSHFVAKIYYEVVASGNILIGDELEMVSRHKTFAIALSREMVPTARVVVYYLQTSPEEMVVDTLNFFVNGTRSNPVHAIINKGKDFTLHTIEINAIAEPGSYVAFAAMPNDLYSRGLNDGLTENDLIDELVTYDEPARGAYRQLWRLSETEYEYQFYSSTGYGIDANSTFQAAGLLVLTDSNIHDVPNICMYELGERPCFDGSCYHVNQTCDGDFNCPNDWRDEQGCEKEDPRYNNRTANMINRVSRNLRFYEGSGWAWQERFVKPDGMVQIRMEPPKFPLTWMINGLSVSRDLGLGLMQMPIKYDATRYMYIIVEAPDLAIRGEQIGIRVTVFNYWYNDDYLEVLITMEDGKDQYKFVWVDEMGITSAYAPLTKSGDHQTLVFLEPGEAKDIFLPIVSTLVQGELTFTVKAHCFMERDQVTKTVRIMPDGILNYYHTPYLIDMIKYGSETIPDLQINVPDQFVVPEVREHLYVPGSGVAQISLFGDVVTPGFYKHYMNCEDIFRKPYGAAEMNMFNFAYNLLTLKFKKANQQLSPETLATSLEYLNVGFQRQLSYMNDDGSFRMFRDDNMNTSSVWLSAFVAKTLHEARFGEWERDLFIPIDLIDKIVVWLCNKQNETGAWHPQGSIYDRKFSSILDNPNEQMFGHPVPLTAYVLIALYKIETDVSGAALSCIDKSRQLASEYLSREAFFIPNKEIFHLAISAYALSLSQQKSRNIFDKLWSLRISTHEIYFSDTEMPENPSDFINTVRYLKPRIELLNDGYAVQSTAYALMAHIKHNGMGIDSDTKIQRDSMMRWLNSMRNFIGGFAASQDSLMAMEALFEYTQVDPNRNVFNIMIQLEASATPEWRRIITMQKDNYTNMAEHYADKDYIHGTVRVVAQGVGRSMIQLTTTVNVEYPWLIKPTDDEIQFFELTADNIRFTGRNSSVMEMTPCVRWVYLEKSLESGLTVLEVDIPTGYVVMNHTLRDYVQSGMVPNLKRAEMYYRKVVFYFSHIDNSKTCVKFRADRWYPVANMTIQHRMRVYDYYEPGMHNTTMYTTYNMFNLNICYVCGSYQCPYCPFFNVAAVIKGSCTIIALLLGFIATKYTLRTV